MSENDRDNGREEVEPEAEATDAPTAEAKSDKSEPKADKPEPKQQKSPRTPADRRKNLTWVVAPVAAFLVFVGLILATGTPSSADLMKQATKSFGEVNRGAFTFSITITPEGAEDALPSTIKLSGPFEIVPGKDLPIAKIEYTVSSGGRGNTVTLLTTGDKAYTVIQGQAYELPASATKELKAATKQLSEPAEGESKTSPAAGLTGLSLNFDKWLVNPKVAAGREIDGTATWQTTADVNIVEAIRDLTASAGTLGSITGSEIPELSEKDVAEIKKGISDASVVVYVGRYDRIVRLIDLTMDFSTPEDLTESTGGVTGGRMNMVIGISKPNQPVDVAPPKDPLPYSALQSLAEGAASQSGTALDDGEGK